VTLAPVLITIIIVVIIIISIQEMVVFARSEIERMRNLERYADEYFKNILPVIEHKNTPTAVIAVAKEVGNLIGDPSAARTMYKILTKKKVLPGNDYQNIFEEFRASHPELAKKLGEAFRAARLAWTFANRDVGPQTRILLELRDLQTKRDVWFGHKKENSEGNLALSADVLNFMWEASRLTRSNKPVRA
jgi:hypothetical protein